jgi:hypothetical protein
MSCEYRRTEQPGLFCRGSNSPLKGQVSHLETTLLRRPFLPGAPSLPLHQHCFPEGRRRSAPPRPPLLWSAPWRPIQLAGSACVPRVVRLGQFIFSYFLGRGTQKSLSRWNQRPLWCIATTGGSKFASYRRGFANHPASCARA